MKYKKLIKERKYKAGYIIKTVIRDGTEYGCDDWEMSYAETLEGFYIGDSKWAHRLCTEKGIKPEIYSRNHTVCSIGFCEKEQKWYGWSHRAIHGFGIGDMVKEDDCTASSGWTQEYYDSHPEADLSLPVGYTAKTLKDAKRMAIAFADSVS